MVLTSCLWKEAKLSFRLVPDFHEPSVVGRRPAISISEDLKEMSGSGQGLSAPWGRVSGYRKRKL